MKRMLGVFLVLTWLFGPVWSADEKAMAVVDKAIKAMGGQERFDKAQTTRLRYANESVTASGVRKTIPVQFTAQGLEHFRTAGEVDPDGNITNVTFVINGNQGWAMGRDRKAMELKPDIVGPFKRSMLERLLPTRPDLLKSKLLELEWAGEQMIGDRPTVVIKVSGLGNVDTKIYFDRERGLPIKSEARVSNASGDAMVQRIFDDREFDGIQVATKIECRNETANPSVEHIKEFKILDKVPADTFTEPK